MKKYIIAYDVCISLNVKYTNKSDGTITMTFVIVLFGKINGESTFLVQTAHLNGE